jgi:2-polyprenyl-3-methyl-5-hydroxy-6-metoxy-1,4-benzoquinol methylase
MMKKTEQNCPGCFSQDISVFHQIEDLPVNSVLNIRRREQARMFQRGNIFLGFCKRCGFIYNTAFNPQLLNYSSDCEESQGYSPTFNQFQRRTAVGLIEKYNLRNKTVLEIGCGKGKFLKLLCDLGENQGIGFDPAYVEGRHKSINKNQVSFIKDFYSEKYAHYQADFICCLMTLEHISDTANFVRMLRRAILSPSNTVVFFQVPNVIRILEECAFEDIYYEHCSYFSPGSLSRLFRFYGFEVLHIGTAYNKQYIMLAARPRETKTQKDMFPIEEDPKKPAQLVAGFQKHYQTKIAYWRDELQKIRSNGKKAVLWGSGSKGVAFLTTLNVNKEIEYVVDINHHRQGTYMAGTGQSIVEPEFLQNYRPDTVIIMNAIYLKEIRHSLLEMGCNPETLIL